VLDQIRLLVQRVDETLYRDFEQLARERMVARDVEDWPIVAVALMLKIPVWTEDRDFFGSGVATWATENRIKNVGTEHGLVHWRVETHFVEKRSCSNT
jgi:predicted nucleic acid-binding protein